MFRPRVLFPTSIFLHKAVLNEYNSFESPIKASFNKFETQVLGRAVQWRGNKSLDDVKSCDRINIKPVEKLFNF